MRLFFLIFLSIYGSIHLYAFMKAKAALAFGPGSGICVIIFMLAMVLAPAIVRYSERFGFRLFGRIMAHIGFIWGAVLYLFFSASLVIDLYRLAVYLAGLTIQKDFSPISLSKEYSFFIPLFLSLCISVYGYFEARDIRTERILIKTPKIPIEKDKLKIVQITDVHLGLMVRAERLKLILDKVRAEEPDILVSTGDLLDGQVCNLNGLEDLFSNIRPKYGKFAITGNHEFYAGIDNTRCFIENAGFTFLEGEGVTLAGIINIAGVDDPAGKAMGLTKDISEKELLSTLPREKYTVLLKHRPLVDKTAMGLFDLQLSGHIHKGQIFPFTLVTALLYPITAGKLDLPDNSFMYVSRGSGTWGPPIRFLAPPEVTVIELVHKD